MEPSEEFVGYVMAGLGRWLNNNAHYNFSLLTDKWNGGMDSDGWYVSFRLDGSFVVVRVVFIRRMSTRYDEYNFDFDLADPGGLVKLGVWLEALSKEEIVCAR